MSEQYAEAIMFFSEHISRHPGDMTAYHCRAGCFWYTGELERSISDFSRVLERKPRDVLALSDRGQVLVEAGKAAEALKDLDYALQLIKNGPPVDPYWIQYHKQGEPFVHRGRGVALAALGNHAAALEELNLSLAQCPENAWAYYSRAEFYEASGEHEKAAKDYRLALEKNGPALNPIRRERARARLQM
jgi:tetratricopeptide (TPR) repeat protein